MVKELVFLALFFVSVCGTPALTRASRTIGRQTEQALMMTTILFWVVGWLMVLSASVVCLDALVSGTDVMMKMVADKSY